MQTIQSIICFNGGAAGDIVKLLAMLAYEPTFSGTMTPSGAVTIPQYFKKISVEIQKQAATINDIDWAQVNQIENSHVYLDFYDRMTQTLYYIDYRDELNSVILSEYIKKRHRNSWDRFYHWHCEAMPIAIRRHITEDNYKEVFETVWMKNLKRWRSNPKFTAINFDDLLRRSTMLEVAQTVANKKIQAMDQFDQAYAEWYNLNSILIEAGTK